MKQPAPVLPDQPAVKLKKSQINEMRFSYLDCRMDNLQRDLKELKIENAHLKKKLEKLVQQLTTRTLIG